MFCDREYIKLSLPLINLSIVCGWNPGSAAGDLASIRHRKLSSTVFISAYILHILFGGTLRHVRGCKWFFPSSYDSSTIFREVFIQNCHLVISGRKSSKDGCSWMYLKHRWEKWPLRLRWPCKVQVRWHGVDYSSSLLTHKALQCVFWFFCLFPYHTLSLNRCRKLVLSFPQLQYKVLSSILTHLLVKQ